MDHVSITFDLLMMQRLANVLRPFAAVAETYQGWADETVIRLETGAHPTQEITVRDLRQAKQMLDLCDMALVSVTRSHDTP